MIEQKEQVEKIRQAFNLEFGRFNNDFSNLTLAEAENLQRELSEFKTKHTGKKSQIAESKKLIGRVPPESRGEFGQFVQSVEKEIVTAIEEIETRLKTFISEVKIAKEAIAPGFRRN